MRLIDADAFKKAIIRHLCLLSEKYLLDSERTIYDLIDKQPTVELPKEQRGLTFALEQANATINYLNEEKEKAIKEIEERKAFNLKCDGQPEWLRKGIDIGLNTALDILKGKDGEQE